MEENSDISVGDKQGYGDTIPHNLKWIQDEAPGFSLCGDQIKVIFTPDEFYSAVIEGCYRAKRRIMLAALYIGTGSLEQNLVKVLEERMTQCGKDLCVSILLDALRGSRDERNGVQTLLLPLIHKHPHCKVSLYHTPELRGFWLRVLPAKVNETVGTQHIKIYVFDDDIIISGANLTQEYFTERQDRYMLIPDSPRLADFCHGLIEKISSVSLRLTEDNSLVASVPHLHPYLSPTGQYEKHARDIIWNYYMAALRDADKTLKPGDDTWLFPLLQLPPLQILQDSRVTQDILESAPAQSTVHLASPYFNPPDEYIKSFLHKCKASFKILMAHPTASDFFGARGFAGQVPSLYTALASSFLHRVQGTDEGKRFSMAEFVRPGGSYHSKGIWVTAPGEEYPHLTITGSSNFNHRSCRRDLECQMVILTSNPRLRQSLQEEKQQLYKHGVPFTHEVTMRPDRKPKLWQHLFLWLFKGYL